MSRRRRKPWVLSAPRPTAVLIKCTDRGQHSPLIVGRLLWMPGLRPGVNVVDAVAPESSSIAVSHRDKPLPDVHKPWGATEDYFRFRCSTCGRDVPLLGERATEVSRSVVTGAVPFVDISYL